MNKKARIIFYLILIAVVLLGFIRAEAINPKGAVNPKISSRIAQLIEKHKSGGRKASLKFAIQSNIEIVEEDKIEVVFELAAGENLESAQLAPYNAEIKSKFNNLIKIKISISQLEAAAESFNQVKLIRFPLKPYPVETSQGVNLTGADIFQNDGYKGSGTKVAIIDGGFIGYTNAQTNGDLPGSVTTIDYTGTGIAATTEHGTAVAEIVYDMAPEAQLYLMKIGDSIDLGNAKDYCKSNGIDIINHSMAWFNSGPGDGTPKA